MAVRNFVSLGTCLRNGTSEGALATAIEEVGIYTWDRYGRFKLFNRTTTEARDVLDYLAHSYAVSESPNDEDDELRDDGGPDSVLTISGWPEDKLPKFVEDANAQPKPRSAGAIAKEEGSNLTIIGALLAAIGLVAGVQHRSKYQSDAQLIEWIDATLGRIPGLSKRSLEGKFADARRQIRQNLPQS